MKRRFFLSVIILAAGLMLAFPQPVFDGASKGILLWFNIVLPTLLPFMILTNLLVATPAAAVISRVTGPLFCRLFHVSGYGSFAVLTGFLCGYPMGSKVTADLIRGGYISLQEGNYLLSFCNNTSPMFIMSFVVWQNLKSESLLVPALVILMLSPIMLSFFFHRLYYPGIVSGRSGHQENTKGGYADAAVSDSGAVDRIYPALQGRIKATVVDDCIMDGFTAITKVGGYIMLFSIFVSLAGRLPFHYPWVDLGVLPSLEITNGIRMICASCPDASLRFLLVMALTSFGGWCSIAQTQCMIQGTGLKIVPYTIEKLVTSVVTSLLAVSFIFFFG